MKIYLDFSKLATGWPVETQDFASPMIGHYQMLALETQDFASLHGEWIEGQRFIFDELGLSGDG